MNSLPTPSDSDAITPEGLEALKEELHRLETLGRRDMAARIQAARELGDLKENAEYHIAKEDQGHLETKILRLAQRLRNARVVEATASDVVSFGGTVTVVDETSGREATYTIVGSTEADAPGGKLSAESPVAQALLGRRAGDVAIVRTPGGERRFRVERIG
jgi:transcription elongation factor GreA